MADDFATSRSVGRDDRAAAGGCFDQHLRHAFTQGRKADDVRLCQHFLHVVALTPPFDMAGISPLAELVNADSGRVAGIGFSDEDKPRGYARGAETVSGFDEFHNAFVAEHARG